MDPETRNLYLNLLSGLQRGRGYLARAEIERILAPSKADPKRLEPFGFKVYSQGDEDGIIQEIFKRIGVGHACFCEIGVEDGLECNSLYLLHKGWTGSWVEGNMGQKEKILHKFAPVLRKRLEVEFDFVTAENANKVLERVTKGNGELDFLSIDVDGNDIYLVGALSVRPRVVCIEYNAKFPPDISKQQKYDPSSVWSGTDYMGSSLKAISDLAGDLGYRLVGTNITGSNAFFVRADLCHDHFTLDCSTGYLYNPPRYWLIDDHYKHIGHRPDFGPYLDFEN